VVVGLTSIDLRKSFVFNSTTVTKFLTLNLCTDKGRLDVVK
jgi:hypothetical protein